ncbi:MAG: hypothetical protein KDC34_05320 [Saprospiraceae bacterium]|nr:hypothetical protein [Saprospiraceae bacterium]
MSSLSFKYGFLLFICGFLGVISCTEDPPPTLGPKDIKIVDSLYQTEVILLKPILDSICEANYDSLLRRATDSMFTNRVEEIERQLERIRNQQ